ncbi:M17 family peptidase N-terminal domain-containing protein [Deefgea sp. CFH1-16]|uniref:M17 family peptidase N-terminal domain-containing protein n=1 Tax=Deefgea sp. CFH1-16 TaxID=2675457 RepID=UPI0015F4121A|nr:M17 family peptidase N-terminal domain-containing protein [Deefgea sp. CFH1-16]
MEFTIVSPAPEHADCVVLPVLGEKLPSFAKELDISCGHLFTTAIQDGELAAKVGSTVSLGLPVSLGYKRVLLVQLGKEPNIKAIRDASRAIAKALLASKNKTVCLALSLAQFKKQDNEILAQELVQALMLEAYRFEQFKSEPAPAATLEIVSLVAPKKNRHRAHRSRFSVWPRYWPRHESNSGLGQLTPECLHAKLLGRHRTTFSAYL